jgi:hypothetical protein
MIATSGEWLGNTGVVHAAVTTAIPASNADGVGRESFADAMRQSGADAIVDGGGKSQEVIHGVGEHVALKSTVAKVPTRLTPAEASKQLNGKDTVIADEGTDGIGSVSDVVLKTMPGAPPVAKNNAADDSAQSLAATPSAMPVAEAITVRIKVVERQLGEARTAAGDASKTKAIAGKNASRAIVSKESQTPANIVVSNAAVDSTVNPQTTPVAQVSVNGNTIAVQASVEAKSHKKTPEQGAVLTVPIASSADVITDAASNITDAPGVVNSLSEGAFATVTTETSALYITDMSSVVAMAPSIHPVNTSQVSAPLMSVKRETDGTFATATGHTPSSVAGELRLSTFEAGKPGQIEVGLRGGEFGWLKVRAELGANGEVNAYLRGASASVTNLLQTTAPRIETYLGAQEVAVRSVQVEIAHMHGGSLGSVFRPNSDATAGDASQQQDSGNRRRDADALPAALVDDTGGLGSVEEIVPMQLVSSHNSVEMAGTGNWLSVRA